MNGILERLRDEARGLGVTIALPEATDARILAAAREARRTELCRPLLIGRREEIEAAAACAGIELDAPILDPALDPELETMRRQLEASLAARGKPVEGCRQLVSTPLYYGNLLLRCGRVGGVVAGAVATTSETLRAALTVVGVDPRYEVVTSCFLMVLEDGRALIYADCGVLPAPTPAQLADVAMQAADTYRLLVAGEPRVALLSFSTKGSARHPSLEPIRRAVKILGDRGVDFDFDGELQADAALVPEVARRKAASSPVAGAANVLVFPDLNSGNIAYKLTERLAGARAVGPLLRGLDRPVHDLSRGCSVDDVLDTMAITALEASRRHGGVKDSGRIS